MRPAPRRTAAYWLAEESETPARRASSLVVQWSPRERRTAALVCPSSRARCESVPALSVGAGAWPGRPGGRAG
ncbi:hypothetical protein [Streptomyces sp. NBC_01511]|uniref:hypothetical protein n=1 Tax=Streptomyces sp. NBC_01511 TaxID=2903889 RepID=UPI003869C4AE